MATNGDNGMRAEAKRAFCSRLGPDWIDFADALAVPLNERDRFPPGDQARALWEWLERRQRLGDLSDALIMIGRHDLADLVPGSRETAVDAFSRSYGKTRAALDGAKIMPLQRRGVVTEQFVPAMDRAIEHGRVVAVVADAGMGKSVLLGQLYDVATDQPDLGVVLLSCAALVGGRAQSSAALDAEAGRAACGTTSLLDTLRTFWAMSGRAVLLIDTIDLILDPATVPVLSQLLREVVDADVGGVLTCRLFEFETLLYPVHDRAPLLATAPSATAVPPTTKPTTTSSDE